MQGEGQEFLKTFGGLVVMLIAMGIGVAISVVVCFLVYDAQKRLPPQFRQIEPGMIWLLLIPCFNIVWNFIALPKVSRSYKAYFDSLGRTDVEDCGEKLGMWYAICAACALIPCVGSIAGIAGLVLLIMYLVKISSLKNQVVVSDADDRGDSMYQRQG